MITLDASALLALLFEEPGHERVYALLPNACMSTVSVAEVLSRLAHSGHDVAARDRHMREIAIEYVAFSPEHARRVAELVPLTSAAGLSLGDRACLALAMERGLPAVTADQAWSDLALGVEIVVVR